ncbi:MAG TPA: tryptophan 2,3-dioxygenase family protein [Candidatus Eisenbacteria bacterium]|nr:tryptophan 2,3-dioxygenase family protein [Candidatus Eisenbacteria bacterium]
MPLTYADYLQLDRLLELQSPRSNPPEHDEMLFIITHQTYELWFKEVLHELEKIQVDFHENRLFEAIHTMKRLRTIMKILVAQLDILETMTPMSFTSFRDRLDTASGFQSFQFREIEYLLGYKRANMLAFHPEGSAARSVLERRQAAPSVVDSFYRFLQARGVEIPEALRSRDLSEPNGPDPEVQEGIFRLYREEPSTAILFELMTDFDEGFQEWRYRHVILVARTIGEKRGTGGSLGVEFLKQSLFKPVFPDLWAIRHRL